MTKYYKLTDKNSRTANETQWGEGVTHKATGEGNNLCSSAVIHVYDHPLKAVLFNPAHASFSHPILWEAQVKKVVANDGLKIGVKECKTIKQLPLPIFTTTQRVGFAILAAKEVCKNKEFNSWADKWLSGQDRSARAASWAAAEAARAARAAARAASWAAAEAASWAAAEAASWAASWAATEAAAEAARAAARAASWAAEVAARAASIDFVALAKKALKELS